MRWIFGYILLLLTSCSFEPKPFNPEDYRKDPNLVCDRMMRPVDKRFDKKMREEGLRIVGAGGGRTDGKERIIGYTLKVSNIPNIDSARTLIVRIVSTYLDILNNTKDIENCLMEYPFPPERLNITIIAEDSQDPKNSLASVSSWKGHVCYYVRVPSDIFQAEKIRQETFAEAKAIVERS